VSHSTETYKLFADYYDLYVGKFDSDLEFYTSLCDQHNDILEIGCGTGRILKFFLEHYYRITGIDISDEMLEKSRQKLKIFEDTGQLELLNLDLSAKALPLKFDIVLITFYTFNYLLENPAPFLRNVTESLKDNGMLVMDLFYPKSFTNYTTDNQWTEHSISVNKRDIKIKDHRRMVNNIEIRKQVYCENGQEITIETVRKYYSPLEVKSFIKDSGFKEILFSTTYNQKAFSPEINENELKSNFLVWAKK
jgi:SAM-dependent methyltransferase